MKALITTNHLTGYTGSEILAIEVSEELRLLGWDVTIASFQIGKRLAAEANKIGITVVPPSGVAEINSFNLVWSQHHVLPLLAKNEIWDNASSFRISCHLSATERLEWPLPIVPECFMHAILANCDETRDRLVSLGIPYDRIRLFPNPAPKRFRSSPSQSERLRRLLIVSNHIPNEIITALQLLVASGIEIRVIGQAGLYARLTEHDVRWSDAVITIGKSVQYAILARRPVFCYDVFGGPGWLNHTNFSRARQYNFSGRCSGNARSGQELATELRKGFAAAKDFAASLSIPDEFDLSKHIRSLVEEVEGGKWRSALVRHDQQGAVYLRRLEGLCSLAQPITAIRAADGPSPDDLAWQESVLTLENRWGRALLNAFAAAGPEGSDVSRCIIQATEREGASIIRDLGSIEPDEVEPMSGCDLAFIDGISVSSLQGDPGFVWRSRCLCSPTDHYVLLVEIDAAFNGERTECQVFYLNHFFQWYSEDRSTKRLIYRGRNILCFPFMGLHLALPIRIDPGALPGIYRFVSMFLVRS